MTFEQQILKQLKLLPFIKQAEVLDFIHFLAKQKQGNVIPHRSLKRIGLLKGKLTVADDFDAPLPDEVLKEFYTNK